MVTANKYMKRWSTSLVIQIKITRILHLTLVKVAISLKTKQYKTKKHQMFVRIRKMDMESLYTLSGNGKCCVHYGKYYGGASKIKNRITCNLTIPFLGIFQKNLKSGP